MNQVILKTMLLSMAVVLMLAANPSNTRATTHDCYILADNPSDSILTILDYDFENEVEGKRPEMGYYCTGGTLNHTNASITTVAVGGYYGNVICFESEGRTENNTIGSLFLGQYLYVPTTLSFEFNLYHGNAIGVWDWTQSLVSISMTQAGNNAGTDNFVIAPNNDTHARTYQAGGAGTVNYVEQDSWHNVTVVLNPSANTALWYFDGEYQYTQSYSHTYLAYINFYMKKQTVDDYQNITVYFDNIMVTVEDSTPTAIGDIDDTQTALSIVFDDGYLNMTDIVLPIMGDNVATSAVIPHYADSENQFADYDVMGWDEIQTLVDAGWEIASHGFDHATITSLNESEMRDNFLTSRTWIEDNTTAECLGFIYPASQRTAATDAIMYEYFQYSRFDGDMPQLNINAQSTYYGTELANYGYYTMGIYTPCLVYGHNSYVGVMMHNVHDVPPYDNEYSTAGDAFEKFIDGLTDNATRFETPNNYWRQFRNAMQVELSEAVDGTITVEYPDDSVNRTYNTVLIKGDADVCYGAVSHYAYASSSVWSIVTPDDYEPLIQVAANSYPFWVNISVSQSGALVDDTVLQWTTVANNSDDVFNYTLCGLLDDMGYKLYIDDSFVMDYIGSSVSFSAIGSGDFELRLWYSNQVSTLVILVVNMVGLGIIVSVAASFISPLSRDIKAGRQIRPDKYTPLLIRTFVFIIIGLVMWVLLHSIAIG